MSNSLLSPFFVPGFGPGFIVGRRGCFVKVRRDDLTMPAAIYRSLRQLADLIAEEHGVVHPGLQEYDYVRITASDQVGVVTTTSLEGDLCEILVFDQDLPELDGMLFRASDLEVLSRSNPVARAMGLLANYPELVASV